MATDWKRLLVQHRVEYVEHGPSTARDNVYVHCPWCGQSDRSHHMGISLRGRGWGCWRNARHRGRSDAYLLAALLRVPLDRARAILGQGPSSSPSDLDLAAQVRATLDKKDEPERLAVELPGDMHQLWSGHSGRRFVFLEYLQERGYEFSDASRIAEHYDLHFATRGPFTYRIVLPVRDQWGELCTFTGRTVSEDEGLRYLTLSTDPASRLVEQGMPLARGPITDYLFQEDRLFATPPRTLVVVEGPFDAIRVDWAHRSALQDYIMATCLFGKALSAVQLDKLATVSDFVDEKLVLLDPDARFQTFDLVARLEQFGFRPMYLSDQWEDPGDPRLPLSEIRRLVAKEVRRLRSR